MGSIYSMHESTAAIRLTLMVHTGLYMFPQGITWRSRGTLKPQEDTINM